MSMIIIGNQIPQILNGREKQTDIAQVCGGLVAYLPSHCQKGERQRKKEAKLIYKFWKDAADQFSKLEN